MEVLDRINWLTVLIATVVGFGVGAVWFNKNVFGRPWMEDLGYKEGGPHPSMAATMGGSFVTTLISAFGLAWLIRLTGAMSLAGGAKVGLLVGLAFVATSYLSDGLFESRKHRLIAITASHRAVMFVIMGAILGAWR